jgi:hypothetical protein
MGSDFGIESVRREADAGRRVLQDIGELAAMQLGVGGHRCQSRVPDAEHQFEIVRRVLRDDGDALAGLKAEALPQGSDFSRHRFGLP